MTDEVVSIGSARRRRPEWTLGLLRNKEGQPKRSLANTMHVLATHPEWCGVLAYDEFAGCLTKVKDPPVRKQDHPGRGVSMVGDWTDDDSSRTVAWVASECGFEPTVDMVERAAAAQASKARFHPVREYLDGLVWDGRQRLPGLLTGYFGASDSEYSAEVGKRWLISAVARVFEPGCKADCMLVLEGVQGARKSTGIRILAGEWYADTGIAVGDKDSYQALRRVWIYEFAELASIRGREAERVKNFVSSQSDHYRPSYGRSVRDFPRQVVFAGTTNESQYLVDRTGNRRFWPVACGRVDVEALQRDRDQLWAEAVERYRGREPWHVDTPELAQLCSDEQSDRKAPDDWIPIVERWLKSPTVPDPDSTARDPLRHSLDISIGLSTADVLLGAIGMKPREITQAASVRAGFILRELGFQPDPNPKKRGEKRVRLYFRGTECTERKAGCAP